MAFKHRFFFEVFIIRFEGELDFLNLVFGYLCVISTPSAVRFLPWHESKVYISSDTNYVYMYMCRYDEFEGVKYQSMLFHSCKIRFIKILYCIIIEDCLPT
jgi:hypothetical protein